METQSAACARVPAHHARAQLLVPRSIFLPPPLGLSDVVPSAPLARCFFACTCLCFALPGPGRGNGSSETSATYYGLTFWRWASSSWRHTWASSSLLFGVNFPENTGLRDTVRLLTIFPRLQFRCGAAHAPLTSSRRACLCFAHIWASPAQVGTALIAYVPSCAKFASNLARTRCYFPNIRPHFGQS